MLITCPSGLTFQARKWKISDRRNLHDQQIVRGGLLMRKMLEAVDLGIEDPGPYSLEVGAKMNWGTACLSDIIAALVAIRVESKEELDYIENCESCGARIPITIHLKELELTPMSAEGKRHLSTDEPYTIALPTEKGEAKINLRMLRGTDMARLAKHYRNDPKTVPEVQMVMHIDSIEVGAEEIKGFKKLHAFYADQDWAFQNGLDDAISEMGGGLITQVEMDCLRCNAEQQGALPFGGDFFYPQKKTNISSMATL